MNERARHQFAILRDSGHPVPQGASILDFGCGAGNGVRAMRESGYAAFGCDVELHADEEGRALRDSGILRPITMEPYRVPFENASFDALISNEVFEHVQDYDTAIREIHRLLKPGGASLHLFPARWMPVEPHVNVPLAGFFRPRWWLLLWARMGRRNPHQKDLRAVEVARLNEEYLRTCTNYLPAERILAHFRTHFREVRFVEDVFLRTASSPRARMLYRATRFFPPLARIYSACWNRVLIAVK